jgi:hemerythrin superfamily protein
MTILTALKADTTKQKGVLKTILASKDDKKRGPLFAAFKANLTAHSRAEEKTFYLPLEKTKEGKTEALEGTVKHQIVDRLLSDLAATPQPEAETWTARCSVLQELLEHHIEEEEGDFFKTARKLSTKRRWRRWATLFSPKSQSSACRPLLRQRSEPSVVKLVSSSPASHRR